MHQQSVDTIMPVLSFLQQPAFCIRSNGTVTSTDAAQLLAPAYAAALPQWLGTCSPIYDTWDKTGKLQFTITIREVLYQTTVQPLQDGMLFLLTPCTSTDAATDALSVVSQTMRQPLTELSSQLFLMSNDISPEQYAPIQRQLCLMTRLVSNLTEISRLDRESPKLHFTHTDTTSSLSALLEEVEELCKSTDRSFIYQMPRRPICFYADEALLKRALLNLISNALKFGTPKTPICLRIDSIGTHLLFQVENECPDGGDELLRSAFNRLSSRGLLPDVKWGVGLGIPLANAIARLHGGMMAVDTSGGKATVTLSISLQKTPACVTVSSMTIDYTGGVRQTLLELSDALPNALYER